MTDHLAVLEDLAEQYEGVGVMHVREALLVAIALMRGQSEAEARLVALRDEARKEADSPTHDEWDTGYACASGCFADKLTAILEDKP